VHVLENFCPPISMDMIFGTVRSEEKSYRLLNDFQNSVFFEEEAWRRADVSELCFHCAHCAN
jgi:hypothetical protein